VTASAAPRVLVLGIGNVLWADDGFGVRAVEALQARWPAPPANVRLLDGGTLGLELLSLVREADVLVVFDAVDYGLPPGTLHCLAGSEVPRFLGVKKMSLHQTGFQEVLALADWFGECPRHLLLIGAQPVTVDDFGGDLHPTVRALIEPALARAWDYLAGFGVDAPARSARAP